MTAYNSVFLRRDFIVRESLSSSIFKFKRKIQQVSNSNNNNNNCNNQKKEQQNIKNLKRTYNLPETGLVINIFEALVVKEKISLNAGSQRMLSLPNAGGSSVWSEVLSCELITSLFNASLFKTEMEINYLPGSKITDYSLHFKTPERVQTVVGVSVTRAMKFRGDFSTSDAVRLLEKKLYGCQESTRNVFKEDSWNVQILHIFIEKEYMLNILLEAYDKYVRSDLKNGNLLLLTVSRNARWVFYDK